MPAPLYGVGVDSPLSLGEFAEQNDLGFPLIGDTNGELVDAFDVAMDFEELGTSGVAKRSGFVADQCGTVTYTWASDDPGVEPDYEAVEVAAAEAPPFSPVRSFREHARRQRGRRRKWSRLRS